MPTDCCPVLPPPLSRYLANDALITDEVLDKLKSLALEGCILCSLDEWEVEESD